MKPKRLRFAHCVSTLALTLILPVVLAPSSNAQDTRTLTANESDQGLTAVEFEGHVGSMQIRPATSGGVRVQVEIRPSRSSRRVRGNPQSMELRSSRSGSTLVVNLTGDHEDLEEIWMIEVPAHLLVEAELGVGDITLQGIRGGLRAKVGVGSLNVDVPEGGVTAETGVGKVSIKSGTTSYGNVDLRTGVGNGRLSIDGREFRQEPRPPGPSQRISFGGNGRDEFRIKSGVGDVELTIGR